MQRSLRIDGLVAECLDLRLAELELMPQHELRDDFRCREGWVVPDLRWRGVLLETFLRSLDHIQALAALSSRGMVLLFCVSHILKVCNEGFRHLRRLFRRRIEILVVPKIHNRRSKGGYFWVSSTACTRQRRAEFKTTNFLGTRIGILMIQIRDRNHAATKQPVAKAIPIAGSGNQYRSERTR